MPKTFLDGAEVKKWYVDEVQVKKAYLDEQLVFSDGFTHTITASDHNIGVDWLWNRIGDAGRAATNLRIVIAAGVSLVTASTSIRGVFDFYGGWGGKVIVIENNGTIVGRGGNGGYGGSTLYPGEPGGRGIFTDGTASVSIINNGVIAGGGGGGGGGTVSRERGGGGGGGGYGLGGGGNEYTGEGGSLLDGGAPSENYDGVRVGGTGGFAGGAGTAGKSGGAGGAGGEATRGPINWIILGTVHGARA